jgi:hypothetical protein
MNTRTIPEEFTGAERRVSNQPYAGVDRRRSADSTRVFFGEQALDRYGTTLFLGMLMFFVATLSFAVLGKESIRLDEAQSLWQTGRSLEGIFYTVAEDVHVPLYHVLLHYWRILAGDGIASARLFSLIFFLGTIPAAYHLGRLAYGKSTGMFIAFLVAISPFLNWYGNEARMPARVLHGSEPVFLPQAMEGSLGRELVGLWPDGARGHVHPLLLRVRAGGTGHFLFPAAERLPAAGPA